MTVRTHVRPIDPYRLGQCRECYAPAALRHNESCTLDAAATALAEYLEDRAEVEPEDTAYGRMAFAAYCAADSLIDHHDYQAIEAAHLSVAPLLSAKADDEGGGYFIDLGPVSEDEDYDIDDRINLTALEPWAVTGDTPPYTWLLYSNGGAELVAPLTLDAHAEKVAAWVREVRDDFRAAAVVEAAAAAARFAARRAAGD